MAQQEAREHHYVPKLLLKPWLVTGPKREENLHGYWWNPRSASLACKHKGLKAFCVQLDLLTLRSHKLGRDALERIFFGEIDTKGAVAKDKILNGGLQNLTNDERCDFARLLLSLEARRPKIVQRMRDEGRRFLEEGLDADKEIADALRKAGITQPASSFVREKFKVELEDRAVSAIQKLVDNATVGGELINAEWKLRELKGGERLILSDRPLIRVNGYKSLNAVWIMPLTPQAAFIAAKSRHNLDKILRLSDQRFMQTINVSSAQQAERFAFSINQSDAKWIGKYLKR